MTLVPITPVPALPPWRSDPRREVRPDDDSMPGGWLLAEPPELTETEMARISEAVGASRASSTLAGYASQWHVFEQWCRDHGHSPFPTHPATLCAFLTERAAAGYSINSLNTTCSAIARYHRDRGLPSPVSIDSVRQVRRGLRRMYGTRIHRPAHPLNLEEIQRMVTAIDRTRPTGIRDAAVILFGYASALRGGEVADLAVDDLEPQPGGLFIHIRASKTDREGHGQMVGIVAGQHAHTDPLAALDAWLELRGTAPGPLFTSMRGVWSHGRVRLEPISQSAISYIVRERAKAAGLDAERISGHSLRAGHATSAALAGVPLEQIAAQTRHRQINVLVQHYIRPAQTLQRSSSQYLGL